MKPTAQQKALMLAKETYIFAPWARRSGKTTTAIWLALYTALVKKNRVTILTTNVLETYSALCDIADKCAEGVTRSQKIIRDAFMNQQVARFTDNTIVTFDNAGTVVIHDIHAIRKRHSIGLGNSMIIFDNVNLYGESHVETLHDTVAYYIARGRSPLTTPFPFQIVFLGDNSTTFYSKCCGILGLDRRKARNTGKSTGSRPAWRFVSMLDEKNLTPWNVLPFGDSDLENRGQEEEEETPAPW